MKKTIHFLLTLFLLTSGCSHKNDFILKGQISGLSSDTIVVHYQVPEYDIDTIICEKGVFEYSFIPDTFTVFNLILNEHEVLPIYAEKGQTVEIKGTATDFNIKGKGDNKLMNDIFILLRNTPKEEIFSTTDSLIQTNTHSFTNLYLIDKYYAHSKTLNYVHLNELIDKQSGIIKDTPYMIDLQAKINAFLENQRGKVVYNLKGAKDKGNNSINWSQIRNQYILLDFWASWHPESVAEQDSLQRVLQALKKENFRIVSVSLDMDKDAWLKASNRDTTQWNQICDFNGWNSPIITEQNIHKLPANLLLDKNKRVIAHNIRGQELINKVKELIKKDKEKEKERNARKRKNKR